MNALDRINALKREYKDAAEIERIEKQEQADRDAKEAERKLLEHDTQLLSCSLLGDTSQPEQDETFMLQFKWERATNVRAITSVVSGPVFQFKIDRHRPLVYCTKGRDWYYWYNEPTAKISESATLLRAASLAEALVKSECL